MAAHHLAVAAVHSPGQQQMVFFCFPQTLLLQCKYNLDLSLERPATESCGGLSMTKDNHANVDEVEDALKKTNPETYFLKRAMALCHETHGSMVESISSCGDESSCGNRQQRL